MGIINEYGYNITDPQQRSDRLALVHEKVELYSKAFDAGILSDGQMADYLKTLKEFERLERVGACADDVLRFAYEYFSEELNPGNGNNLIPEGVAIGDAPAFHLELCGILNEVSNDVINARVGWAAPRSHAKSAYLSNIFPLHQIAYDLRKYILILSETDSASKKFIEWIALQLKFNVKLREDFGELLSVNKAANDKDNQENFLTKAGTLVEASSIGKQLRGKRNGAYRPDLLILDDLESSKNTNTGELREKNLDWFNKVVIPIGDPKSTAFLYMGTVVHADGLLVHILNRADFRSKKFAAILEEPERADLWEQFESMLRDQELEERKEKAYEFYNDFKEEMDAGTKTLWPDRFSYAKLIEEKVNMGTKAFNSEYMNNPIDIDSQIFRPDTFEYFDYEKLHEIRPHLDLYGAWDIALGKNKRSDYNAIIIVGRDRRNGILYVVDAWAKKVAAHKALEVALEKIIKWKPKIFAVESVAAQFDFYRQLRDLMVKRKVYTTKLKPLYSRTKKEERIESMEPIFENGAIRFMRHQRLLVEQLEQYPSGTHDDLPDCLQMSVDLCSRSKRRTFHRKPDGL